MSILLEAKELSFAYSGQDCVFENINFTLKKGEIIGIMGDSGSGKTTLLSCLAGIIPHIYHGEIRGNVYLEGTDISKMKLPDIASKLGVLFQNPDTQLFSEAVEDDIVFGPENLCRSWQEIDDNLESALKITGMGEKRLRKPKSLSGGEAQLAALAAVLALNPAILLFDEAMSQLDEHGTEAVQACALNLKREGKGIIMVEHDRKHLEVADRIFRLDQGSLKSAQEIFRHPGRLVQRKEEPI